MAKAKPEAAPEQSKGGRPSKYSPELVETICERLSKGEPLAAICRDDGMPGLRTVYDWAEGNASVSARIARAREEGEESIAADCMDIADEECTTVRADKHGAKPDDADGNVEVVFDSTAVQRNKLRIDTRLKLLAKWNPKKWGERLQHANDPDNPMPAPQFIVNPIQPAPPKDE